MSYDELARRFREEMTASGKSDDAMWEFDYHATNGDHLTAIEFAYYRLRPLGFRVSRDLHADLVKVLAEYAFDEGYEDVFEYERITYERLLEDGPAPIAT